jgi:Transposase DDE domain group 1
VDQLDLCFDDTHAVANAGLLLPVMELAIRDLKQGAGLRHCPSGQFLANAAWLVIATLAHNLLRWIAALGLGHRGLVAAKTLRCRLVALPGRLTRSARRWQLHLPSGWPWASNFTQALGRLQASATWPPPPPVRFSDELGRCGLGVVEPVDVAALLPVPSCWQRYDHEDFTCWQFDGERWLINVCDREPIEDLAEVPDRVRQLLPGLAT